MSPLPEILLPALECEQAAPTKDVRHSGRVPRVAQTVEPRDVQPRQPNDGVRREDRVGRGDGLDDVMVDARAQVERVGLGERTLLQCVLESRSGARRWRGIRCTSNDSEEEMEGRVEAKPYTRRWLAGSRRWWTVANEGSGWTIGGRLSPARLTHT